MKYLIRIFVLTGCVVLSKGHRCDDDGPKTEALGSGANDIVVVRQANGELRATPVNVQVGKFTNWQTVFKSRKGRPAKIVVNGLEIRLDSKLLVETSGTICFSDKPRSYRLTTDELERMNLRAGLNDGLFVVSSLDVEIPFSIYFLSQNSRLVVSDIDGTITQSDIKGFVFPQIGLEAHQNNVIELFQKISSNNYTMVYLTARTMANDADTRKYLFQDLQHNQGYSLPMGPLFMSPMPFSSAAYEAVTNPSNTKAATLNQLSQLCEKGKDAIFGAYGNAETDVEAYLKVGIRPSIIFLVNEKGQLRQMSDPNFVTSYGEQAQRVDDLYPVY